MQHVRIDSKDVRRVVTGFLALTAVAFIVLAPAAFAKGDKVTICHIPPGNPENAHSITISVSALQTHLDQHGDSIGECAGDGGGGDGDGGGT
jgi:hypothetical protein